MVIYFNCFTFAQKDIQMQLHLIQVFIFYVSVTLILFTRYIVNLAALSKRKATALR